MLIAGYPTCPSRHSEVRHPFAPLVFAKGWEMNALSLTLRASHFLLQLEQLPDAAGFRSGEQMVDRSGMPRAAACYSGAGRTFSTGRSDGGGAGLGGAFRTEAGGARAGPGGT